MTDNKDRKILSDEEMEDLAGGGAEAALAADLADDGSVSKKKSDEQLVQLVDIRLETFRKG